MKKVLIILFVFFYTALSAQDDIVVTKYPRSAGDSLRANYIKPFPDHFFLWPVIKQRKLAFELERITDGDRRVAFESNKPYSFGVGLYVFELALELAFAVPLDEQSKYIYGESSARDIQLNVLGKKWGSDLYYQKYSGFYINDGARKVASGTPFPQRPDITTRNYGVSINYTFNYNKFSFRSAYNYIERQLRSSGSFLLVSSLNSFRAAADSALLGQTYQSEFGIDSKIKSIQVTSLSLAPGYTYSLIYKGFFLNGALAVGPSHNWITYTPDDAKPKHDIRFNAYVSARIGLGYNGDYIFGGISFMSQANTAKFETARLSSANNLFKILIGYRFREFGVLKKRVWDIPKHLF
ncbi:DUF4421 family protein [Pseudochryseolinea flava]|uniref:DUF4421 domain-containing protein n=1 Tax=Pseudochryseolinea flava TaxID=2059302 RepID=A0A364XXX0_9BACT|nr:DUF4421 family protein [Pseudochryseolinea flava]RAV98413.1 hypothetical protein DQQ10_24105 [Pseudochryseolinea flava]